jgi:hypothetical protein
VGEVLRERLFTAAEDRRVSELRDAFGLALADTVVLDDLLLKVAILRDLDANSVPDRIDVAGEMPVKLRPGESVLWIFNQVAVFKPPLQADDEAQETERMTQYYPLDTAGLPAAERETSDGTGDLLVTTTALHFVSGRSTRRIPALRIAGLQAHRDGIRIAYRAARLQNRLFVLDDVWFAANLIARIVNHALREDIGTLEPEVTPEVDTPNSAVI